MGREPRQPLFVGTVKRRDRHGRQRRETRASTQQRRGRDVDQVHTPEPLAALLEQDRKLLTVAAAKLRDVERPRQRLEHLARVAREQRRLRPRDPVPRQPADGIEERRAQRVVEIARRQLARRPLEILGDVGDEIGSSGKRKSL